MTFDDFLASFFAIYTTRHFRGVDFLAYLQKPRRTGDEASIVDSTIVIPLLGLLGFSAGEQTYNQNNKNGRPDFVPTVSDAGVCFVVEDKSTALDLTLDMADPESHLSQLLGYLRSLGLRTGWLCNGRRLMVWQLDNPQKPEASVDFSVTRAIEEWVNGGGAAGLSTDTRNALRFLWERFRRDTFADLQRVEAALATDLETWEAQALPIGNNPANGELLVGAVRNLLHDLQAEALRTLDAHLTRFDEYARRNALLDDGEGIDAESDIERKRVIVLGALKTIAVLVGLREEETDGIKESLRDLQRSPRAFRNPTDLMDAIRHTINAARARKFVANTKMKPWMKYDNGLGPLGDALQAFGGTVFAFHQRQATLRQEYRKAIAVREDYDLWRSLVQETMLSGMDEAEQRSEFALQATYVTFIRLLLIRVCEDKGILPNRFLSDGGLKRWQEDMERYFYFASGNPYDTLLDMAFQNAQNIYAHFFTGRELFNWYALDRLRFVRVLQQLSRFNFADVDSDIIGTIYNTYVERKEKKKKGQYYTPPEVVRYILDAVGYSAPAAIVGANKRLIDPSCGSGTFLVEAARRLIAAYRKNKIDNPRAVLASLRENLYGFDLNPFACYLAEVNLLIQTLDLVKLAIAADNEPPRLERFHIYNVDALAPASGILYYARANTLMAQELDVVDQIKDRKDRYETGFSFVVANPPYGAKVSESYRASLRQWWPQVFRGQPDTYVFFFALALKLLSANGRLGFITPNTYLMGTNTDRLRDELLKAGRITEIVDLPQGIWDDANVDCALLFLTRDANAASRAAQQTAVYSMDVRDKLDKLTNRDWAETLTQSQAVWTASVGHEMNIRWSPLLQKIEDACLAPDETTKKLKVLRLGDVTDSSQGIIPYYTRAEGKTNLYIKPQKDVPPTENDWKPLLDGSSYVGRYELRLGKSKPYIKYGRWLYTSQCT